MLWSICRPSGLACRWSYQVGLGRQLEGEMYNRRHSWYAPCSCHPSVYSPSVYSPSVYNSPSIYHLSTSPMSNVTGHFHCWYRLSAIALPACQGRYQYGEILKITVMCSIIIPVLSIQSIHRVECLLVLGIQYRQYGKAVCWA